MEKRKLRIAKRFEAAAADKKSRKLKGSRSDDWRHGMGMKVDERRRVLRA
jgi:hypothetical protein